MCIYLYIFPEYLLFFFFQFRNTVLQILAADICGSFIIDRTCSFLFGRGGLRRV